MNNNPLAYALIHGQKNITGTIAFYNYNKNTIMFYQIENLPLANDCQGGIFAFHIHEGNNCNDPKTHYNPNDCEHPFHLGDLPPLFARNGKAWGILMIDKFSTEEIIGKTIVIHEKADDFKTQPSGDSGERLACGEIKEFI